MQGANWSRLRTRGLGCGGSGNGSGGSVVSAQHIGYIRAYNPLLDTPGALRHDVGVPPDRSGHPPSIQSRVLGLMEQTMARKSHVLLLDNGLIAVTQRPYAGWEISWNPDDGMFYVHEPNENLTVRSIVKELRNARQYAATHVPGGEDDKTPPRRAWVKG